MTVYARRLLIDKAQYKGPDETSVDASAASTKSSQDRRHRVSGHALWGRQTAAQLINRFNLSCLTWPLLAYIARPFFISTANNLTSFLILFCRLKKKIPELTDFVSKTKRDS